MPVERNEPDQRVEAKNQNVKFWLRFVRGEFGVEMRKLLSDAKLSKKPRKVAAQGTTPEHFEGWNNVMKHNIVQAAAMRAVCERLWLEKEEKENLVRHTFIHNAATHLDVLRAKEAKGLNTTGFPTSETFTAEEEKHLKDSFTPILEKVDPTGELRTALTPEFFYNVFTEADTEPLTSDQLEKKLMRLPFSQLLQYYMDTIFEDAQIVPALTRIANTEMRRGNLNDEADRTKKLGGRKYWDAEREAAPVIEKIIFERLWHDGVPENELPNQAFLPSFIRKLLQSEANAA